MCDSVSILTGSNSSCDATSIPRHDDLSSEFGDWCCGEPLKTQHVAIDFTPCEELDTEFVQNKCFAFWDFVNKSPELQDLNVLPDLAKYPETEQESSDVRVDVYSQCAGSMSSKSDPCEKNRTALSMLEIAGQRGMVSETFKIRLPNATCANSLGSREYREVDATAAACKKPNNKSKCKCDGKCKSCKSRHPKGGIQPEVKRLSEVMRHWEYDHPKSMEPPGRTPQPSHSDQRGEKFGLVRNS